MDIFPGFMTDYWFSRWHYLLRNTMSHTGRYQCEVCEQEAAKIQETGLKYNS